MADLFLAEIETPIASRRVARLPSGAVRPFLSRLGAAFGRLARAVAALPSAIGAAASMAYADPFGPRERDRR